MEKKQTESNLRQEMRSTLIYLSCLVLLTGVWATNFTFYAKSLEPSLWLIPSFLLAFIVVIFNLQRLIRWSKVAKGHAHKKRSRVSRIIIRIAYLIGLSYSTATFCAEIYFSSTINIFILLLVLWIFMRERKMTFSYRYKNIKK